VDSDKVARTQAITPLIEAGKVFLPELAPWSADYVDELAAFTPEPMTMRLVPPRRRWATGLPTTEPDQERNGGRDGPAMAKGVPDPERRLDDQRLVRIGHGTPLPGIRASAASKTACNSSLFTCWVFSTLAGSFVPGSSIWLNPMQNNWLASWA
jgi:hypothetical protein